MRTENQRRVVAYGAFVTVAAGLAWAGWGRATEADPGTLIHCAVTQMQLASGIPAESVAGRDVRSKILADAERFLERAESVEPNHPQVLVARADFEFLSGNTDTALAAYRRASESEDCTPEQVDQLALRRAQLCLELGRPEDAYADLARIESESASRIGILRDDLRVDVLVALGRTDEAVECAAELAAAGDSEAFLRSGAAFERVGEHELAAKMYRDSTVPSHVGEYCVARLKARQAEFDTAYEQLKRALETEREATLSAIQRDRADWAPSLESERFRELTGLQPAAPR